MARHQDMQRIIRRYKEETGKTEIGMREVARYAVGKGWALRVPEDPLDRLAKEFARAAREEIRKDETTGLPYRANHAVPTGENQQLRFWIDIDEAPRRLMRKSLILRREQMVGDGLQLSLDADHWSSIHPTEEPIVIPLDFTDDVDWRKSAPDDGERAG